MLNYPQDPMSLLGQILNNRYRIIDNIGSGGFADVYKGIDVILHREVVIKMLRNPNRNSLPSFQTEAKILAGLSDHPNIVPIYEVGQMGIHPYFVNMYCSGKSIPKKMLPLSRIREIVKQISTGIQFAHDLEIVHRDIKPENLLVDKFGNIRASDFGIAIPSTSIQRSRVDVSGTLPYMALEQLEGFPVRSSDQYALAVAVYLWISGNLPFRGTETEILGQKYRNNPPSLLPYLSYDNAWINDVVRVAMANEPQMRFSTIEDFAQAILGKSDIDILNEKVEILEAVIARKEEVMDKVGAMLEENEASLKIIKEEKSKLRLLSYGSPYIIINHPELPKLPDERDLDAPLSAIWSPSGSMLTTIYADKVSTIDSCSGGIINRLTYHADLILSAAWSPDGKQLAEIYENKIIIRDAMSGKVAYKTLEKGPAFNGTYRTFRFIPGTRHHWIDWSYDGKKIAVASGSILYIIESTSGSILQTIILDDCAIVSLEWSPVDNRLAIAHGKLIDIIDGISGEIISQYTEHAQEVLSVAWSPDGTKLASGGEDKILHVFSSESGNPDFRALYRQIVYSVTWAPDGSKIASAIGENGIHIYEPYSTKYVYDKHTSETTFVSWAPDGTRIASSSKDHNVHIWRVPEL